MSTNETNREALPAARMSKEANRLTAKRIEKLKTPGRYHDGHGLLLQITPSGSRSWLLRYQRDGREHMHGLGPLHTVTLKEARERAKAARLQLLDGNDPIDARQEKRAQAKLAAATATTFKQAAERFLAAHESSWTNAIHRLQWRQSLEKYAYPKIGELPVQAIDTDLVMKCLEPIWTSKQVTADRVRGRIERVLDWAKARGLREGENPARWRGHLDKLLAKQVATKKHHAALPYEEVPAFLAELRKQEGIGPRALEVLILTGLRTAEVLEAKWSEINLEKHEWIVPADRMKNGKEHKVPLTDRVVEILETLPREDGNPFVFIGAKAGSPFYIKGLFKLMRQLRPGVTTHGFRSSFSDWAHEKTNAQTHIIEMCLAHTVGSAVERAYRRGDLFDKRRDLMMAWESYCLHPEATGKVVPLHGRA